VRFFGCNGSLGFEMEVTLKSDGQGERARAGRELATENRKQNSVVLALGILLFFSSLAHSQTTVTPIVNYQGRVNVQQDGQEVAYEGAVGYFKFAVINTSRTKSYWSNDGGSVDGSEPESAVSVSFPSGDGVFSVSLGGGKMEPLSAEDFANPNTLLRVWFSADNEVFEELKPNERFSTVPYAFRASVAESISPGSLEPAQLSNRFSGMTLVSDDPDDDRLKSQGFARYGKLTSPPWVNASVAEAPLPLTGHTAVVGKVAQGGVTMYVWGGTPGRRFYSSQGWVYDAGGDFWALISPLDAPVGRLGHTAVWAGDRMIVWGGVGKAGHLSDGGVYTPAKLLWEPVLALKKQFFSARRDHVAVWTGSEMLVWGGRNEFDQMNDGAAYNPLTNKWRALGLGHGLGKRSGHTAVWTGSEMLVWGGMGIKGKFGDGAAYDPVSDEWRQTTMEGGPESRSGHTAVWTGSEMLVWGGRTGGVVSGSGYAYDPNKDSWRKLPLSGGPEPREGHTATWTEVEMVIFGGTTAVGEVNTGYALDPKKNKWRSLTTDGGPLKRAKHTAVWAGSEMVVFGGLREGVPLSAPQRLSLQETWYLYRKL
jgi:N-acetylneuraminic acid mutarotase